MKISSFASKKGKKNLTLMIGERASRSRQEVSLRLSPSPVVAVESFAAASFSFVKFLKRMKPMGEKKEKEKQSRTEQMGIQ